jgi:hypothetical protein
MSTTVDGLRLRKVMGRDDWAPPQPFGTDGWSLVRRDGAASVIVSAAPMDDGHEWIHASIAREERMPDYDDLVLLHRAAFGDRWAYQVFAPRRDHVNIHEHALHLWGRVDGQPAIPDFGAWGSI